MEFTDPKAGGRRLAEAAGPEGPGAAARPAVLRQEPGDAVPGRHLALLPVAEVLSRRDAGALLLDGRGPAEFTAGHVRGAVSKARHTDTSSRRSVARFVFTVSSFHGADADTVVPIRSEQGEHPPYDSSA